MLLDKKLVTRICKPLPSFQLHTFKPLELVHTDVYQVSHSFFSECRYWALFINDYLRYRFILPIKAKSDVFEAFKTFKAYETQSECTIKILRIREGSI